MKKKIKKVLYKVVRKLAIQEFTDYLGKIEEYDDKIVCHVNNIKLRRYKESPYYDICFRHYLDKETLKKHKLDKPVYYVIENMNFDRMLKFTSLPNTHVIFKNCKFNDAINIMYADNVTFENNKYYNKYNLYLFNKCFLEGRFCNLEFINENFINSEEEQLKNYFGINVTVDNLKIKNSQICVNEKNGEISLKVRENLIIEDSKICAPIIDIDSKNIEVDDSELNATIGVNINNENNNEIENINAPLITYNGVDFSKKGEITKENYKLESARQQLINKLREIKNHCNNTNNSILNKVSNTLNEKSISKVLKG